MVSTGLETLREDEYMNAEPGQKLSFKHTETMEKLFQLLDQSFDVLNARIPKNGITEEKWKNGSKQVHFSQFLNDFPYLDLKNFSVFNFGFYLHFESLH